MKIWYKRKNYILDFMEETNLLPEILGGNGFDTTATAFIIVYGKLNNIGNKHQEALKNICQYIRSLSCDRITSI